MTTPQTYTGAHDVDDAKAIVADLITRSFESHERSASDRRAMRLEVPIEPVDQLAWLRLQGNMSRGYWSGRDGEFTIAGRGTADVLTAAAETDYDALFTRLRAGIAGVHPNLRYYGGMRFDPQRAADEQWTPFGAYRFILPRFEVLNRGQQSYLACNAVIDGDTDAHALRDELHAELETMPFPEEPYREPVPESRGRIDEPDRDTWMKTIADTVDRIRSGAVEKTVLSRKSTFEFDAALDALSLFAPLSQRAQRAYCFCFQPRPDFAFMGATPERLYKRQGAYIQSEALAGTRRRGDSPEEDKQLADDLMSSDKDRREHEFVAANLTAILGDRCKAVHRDDAPSILQLANVQHLYTKFEGILHERVGIDADLLSALHPTPAIGGLPKADAVEWIRQSEPFDRGWFGGPVGWISADAADFAVGIRSGIVDGKRLSVYAGAGIVEGSVPESEWEETEQKMGQFLAVLTQA